MKCINCGAEVELDLRAIGDDRFEVWFKCGKCGEEWQDMCGGCNNPKVVSGQDLLCTICGA